MNFYKAALGGNITAMARYGDAPMPCSDDYKSKIMHGVLMVGDGSIMFSDSNEQRKAVFGDNFSMSLSFNADDEITRTYHAISAGGTVTMPLQDTFWGAKFGMCCDKFGINWMFNWDKPKE